MADLTKPDLFAEGRLSTTRETELLRSFVRVNVDDNESTKEEIAQISKQLENQDNGNDKDKGHKSGRDDGSKIISRQSTSQNLQKRKKKRNVNLRDEEIYCDKDRAAAVNMGSKDIKQSLRLKRKQDRSRILQLPEEAEPKTFLALGNYEMCRGDLNIALDFITKALELNPSEKNALVARSKCYILLGQPDNALKDVETALTIDKHFLKAIYQKAESLYYLGNFEHSLMYYHRGLHIRPDHEDFKLGVHKAQKAIENAIGSTIPRIAKLPPDSGTCKDSTKSTLTRNTPELSTNRAVSGTSKSSQRTTAFVGNPKSSRKSRLLRELGADKDYLDNLINNPNIKCKYKDDNSSIEKCIRETVDYLNARQEFWRQQLPARLK